MAVTTLTGTTWYLNEVPDTSIESTISVLFSVQGSESQYDVIYKNSSWLLHFAYEIVGGALFTVYSTKTGWADESYRTITFLSEIVESTSTLTQSEFISWLEANATQIIPEPEYVDKVSLISGDEYYIKDTISGYLKGSDLVAGTNISIEETSEGQLEISSTGGEVAARIIKLSEPEISLAGTTWYFNSSLQSIDPPTMYNITFTSNNNEYVKLGNTSGVYSNEVWYNDGSSWTYAYEGGWLNQNYRTIIITDGTDIANSTLIAWLQANATQVS